MAERFRHVAIVGKHQAPGIGPVLEEIAQFLCSHGLDVSLEADTALNTGLTGYEALSNDELGRQCDLAVVIGGDGTMLGFARDMARHGIPLDGWASSPTSRSSAGASRWRRCWRATTRSSRGRCWKARSGATASRYFPAWR
jgi:hypothetical protein